MANKKISYYKSKIKSNSGNVNLDSAEYAKLIKRTISDIGKKKKNIVRLVLEEGDLMSRVNIDIFHDNDDYLFGRVGKLKDGKDSLIRDINTQDVNPLNPGENKMLEIFTYFILDYHTGIVGYAQNKSSHRPYVLGNIINNNHDNYTMELENIVSGETVRALTKPGSKLGKIEYSFVVPDPRILAYVGVSRKSAAILAEEGSVNVNISITNNGSSRRPLTDNVQVITNLIDGFGVNGGISKKKFKGTPAGQKSQTFKFEVENFITNIDVSTTKIVDNEVADLTLDELADEFFVRMRTSYSNNRVNIHRYAGIE
ncbi:hypothetical protein [Terrisporobacter petrolearius]|uniref:hypothetical protein n=1 Tax=Terrisporobacter petrolearius TaxID=1460447 RepID=UPI0031CC4692